jgi:heme-degrading monooxygenase HmoA
MHSILTIPVHPGAEDAFAEAFERLDVFGHAAGIPGFRGGVLLRPLDAGAPFLVHARWDDSAGYKAWLDAPIRAELNDALGGYVAGVGSGSLYAEAVDR